MPDDLSVFLLAEKLTMKEDEADKIVICQDKTIAALDLTHHFSAICTDEDVIRGKPEPDLFLLAASKMGILPEGCVVFEDSDLGLEAARRAGMIGIDVRPLIRRI